MAGDELKEDEKKKGQSLKATVKQSDMPEDLQIEVTEMIVNILEKHDHELKKAANMMKESLDKRYHKLWHVIIGEAYGYELAHIPRTFIQVIVDAKLIVTIWSD